MADSSVSEITQLLRACAEGEVLIPRVYRELRRLAGHCVKMSERNKPYRSLDVSSKRSAEIAALDAVNELARLAPRKPRIVELRLFDGFRVADTAEVQVFLPTCHA